MSLEIVYKGVSKGFLNQALVQRNNVSVEKLEKIKKLHLKKHEIFEEMQEETSVELLKSYAKLVETIEYELQSLWGFTKDKNFHQWYSVPHCKCPKKDNMQRQGTPYQIYNQHCVIHGA